MIATKILGQSIVCNLLERNISDLTREMTVLVWNDLCLSQDAHYTTYIELKYFLFAIDT